MSTHRLSLIVALGVIAAVAVLTISMVAAPHPTALASSYDQIELQRARNYEAASQNSHQVSTAESFGRYELRYAAAPHNASQFSIAQAQRVRDLNEQHAEALQSVPSEQNLGEWYGAIPQNASQLSIAQAQRLHDFIEQHGEALQGP